MGILDNFEKGLERAVNGAFAKTFRSGLQPVEISAALRREMDTNAAIVTRERILAPHSFRVLMNEEDHARLAQVGPALVTELVGVVTDYGRRQGYSFSGPVAVGLEVEPGRTIGTVQVVPGEVHQESVSWTPVLEIAGAQHPVTTSRTVIGRGSDADITIADPGTSRRHVEILWDGSSAQVHDLGSTNGSQLNGQKVTQSVLEPGDVITIGRTRITYRLLAQGQSAKPADDGFWGTHR